MQLRQATRQKAKIRLGLSAVSGGGKTMSALLIAYGLTGDWAKVAMIDTESGSGDLYDHLGPYQVLPLEAPYTPERYIAAIKACEEAGMDVIIIDSITHEWDGKGGCLEIVDAITKASSAKNSYVAWGTVTPRHQAFLDKILTSKCHVITTVRRKQDYDMTKDERGKIQVTKAGLKEITRDNFEYELTINLTLETTHYATASKDRTGLFMDKDAFIPSIETGKAIRQWCDKGGDVIPKPETPNAPPPAAADAQPQKKSATDKAIETASQRISKGELDLAKKLQETYDLTQEQKATLNAAYLIGKKLNNKDNGKQD